MTCLYEGFPLHNIRNLGVDFRTDIVHQGLWFLFIRVYFLDYLLGYLELPLHYNIKAPDWFTVFIHELAFLVFMHIELLSEVFIE